ICTVMDFISIFNDVLGPVMRGPSSSHTAGSYRIGRLSRSLLRGEPAAAVLTFDSEGSYAQTFREQGADLGFAAGLLGWSMTDDRFPQAFDHADRGRIKITFEVKRLTAAEHPNTVDIALTGRQGERLQVRAKSVGGGLIVLTRLFDWEVDLTGKSFDLLVECESAELPRIEALLDNLGGQGGERKKIIRGERALVHLRRPAHPGEETISRLRSLTGVSNVWIIPPLFYVQKGEPLFSSAREMIAPASGRGIGLGRVALEYESGLIGLTEEEAKSEMLKRWEIMKTAVEQGLREKNLKMKIIPPSASRIFSAVTDGNLPSGGLTTRAAARAMAVLHVSSSGGVVCAAPTGASSGVIPGVMATLAEEKNLSDERIAFALFAAGAVGLVVASRATFAAEVAGCQVEIGAAGAMAAAAVVEAAGGTAQQAADAAAISLQNSMGSVCDLVQGICEIPCHTRNAAAAAGAFVCADLILGGYANPIPLDETVDAVFAVGKMLPPELRCTSRGGLAMTPAAQSLHRRGRPEANSLPFLSSVFRGPRRTSARRTRKARCGR
ncbi:MAG: L-serine ammonia-lyase, iron-sulfur-dependent, subunit alpha, partial [Acidobacteriota bacterium]